MVISIYGTQPALSQPTTIPHLTSLTLRYAGDLPLLTLPHLHRLQVFHCTRTNVLLSLISRSTCVLQHLNLRIGEWSADDLLECLQAVPSLVTLAVDINQNNHLVSTLFNQSPSMLPSLAHLTISTWRSEFDYTPLIMFLESRRTPNIDRGALTSFQLDRCMGIGDWTWLPRTWQKSRLQMLIAEGLHLRFGFDGNYWPEESRDECKSFP
ncbi:hypothetical protein B0H10DRAFT_676453 [Mycena sp. CBHHK59/15]|nr:hypothetical protein B0H10DRAFT_676453 [Mycena sp. CBHHK59/15]